MINWKLRLKNKTTLVTLLVAAVAFVYQIFGIVGFVPPVSESEIVQTVGVMCNLAAALGIIVDPTTEGIADSDMAMNYIAPRGGDE